MGGILVLSVILATACGGDADDAPAEGSGEVSGELTAFAAASLTEAFQEIASTLEDDHPGLEITFNFAGSQQLATQLADGAGADLFASANTAQMKAARDADVISAEPVIFTRNRLAIVVPADNPAGITAPIDLAKEGIKLVIANPDVPAGQYALDSLDKMSALPEFGPDFRERVERNIVSHEDNVRQVVAKVQLGEADAGIAYVTDITPDVADAVTVIEIPDDTNVIAVYPIAPVTNGNATLAQVFIDYLLSSAGQEILTSHGFTELAP
jgi:molybdate transport system substrate-binding protein